MATIDDLPEEAKIQALEAGQVVKDMTVMEGLEGMVSAKSLDGQTESLGDMEPGSPKTVGYEADYGETLKPEAAQWPETQPLAEAPPGPDFEPEPPAPTPEPTPEPSREPSPEPPQGGPGGEQATPEPELSEFDKALAMAQQQEPMQGQEHDQGLDH